MQKKTAAKKTAVGYQQNKGFLHSFYGYKKYFSLFVMFIPAIIYFFVFKYIPMYGVTLAFKDYNIRANIGIDGSNYRKYGTTFNVRLVVIDKTGPQNGETITGDFKSLNDIPKIMEGVRNDRTHTGTTESN